MKLKGQLTLLFNQDGMHIEIRDPASGKTFISLELDAKQTCQALSRLGHTHCEMKVHDLDKVGLTKEWKPWEFPCGGNVWDQGKHHIRKKACDLCPEGWEPDLGFNSQGSFFTKGDVPWARTTIRRWVKKEETDPCL